MEEALMHYISNLEEVTKMQSVVQYMQQKQHCLNNVMISTTGFLDLLPMRPPNSKRQKGTYSLQFGQSSRFFDKENLVTSQSVPLSPFLDYSGTITGSKFVERSMRIIDHASSFREQVPGEFFAAAGSKETGAGQACEERTMRSRGLEAVSQRRLLEKETIRDSIQQERETENRSHEEKVMDKTMDVHAPAASSSVTARRGGIKRDRKVSSGARPVTRSSRRLACSSATQDEAHRELEASVAATMVDVTSNAPHLKIPKGRKKVPQATILFTPVEVPEVIPQNAEHMHRGGSNADGDAEIVAEGTRTIRAIFEVSQFRAEDIDKDSNLNRNSDTAAKSGIAADVQKQFLKKTTLCGENTPAAILEELNNRVLCPDENLSIVEDSAAGERQSVRQGQAMESHAMLTGELLVTNKYSCRDLHVVQEKSCGPVSQPQGREVGKMLMVGNENREVVHVSGAVSSSSMRSCQVREDPILKSRKNMQLGGSTLENTKKLKCANFVRQSRAAEQFGLAVDELASGNSDHCQVEASPSDLRPPVNESETGVTSNKPESRVMVGQIEMSLLNSPDKVVYMSHYPAPAASLACAVGGVEVDGFTNAGAIGFKKRGFSSTVEDSGFQPESGDMEVPLTRNTTVEYEEVKGCGSEKIILVKPEVPCVQEVTSQAGDCELDQASDMDICLASEDRDASIAKDEGKASSGDPVKTILVKPELPCVHGVTSQAGDCQQDQASDMDICLASEDRDASMAKDEGKASSGDPECHGLKDIESEAELFLKQQQSETQLSADDGKLMPETCEALHASPDVGRQDVQFRQEINPECTVTLDCCQYQKRLSPRSKARAKRWQSDVGHMNRKGQLRSGVFTDAPERILAVQRDCLEMVECDVCSPPLQEKATVSLTPTFMEASNQLEPHPQQKPWQVIERHLYKEVFSQEFQDGGPYTDDYKDHELMEATASDKVRTAFPLTNYKSHQTQQHENSTSSALLMSINPLPRVSEAKVSSAVDFLKKPEQEEFQQSAQSWTASANKIAAELSGKKVLPVTSASKVVPSGAPISRACKSDNPCASNPCPIQADLSMSRFVQMLSASQDHSSPVNPNFVRLPAVPTMHTACTNVSKSTFTSPIISTSSSPHPVIFRDPIAEVTLPQAVDINVAVINLPHVSSVDPAPSEPFSSISPTAGESSPANLTLCVEQVTAAAVLANVSPRSPAALANTCTPACSRSVDHQETGSLLTSAKAVSNVVGHSPLSIGDKFSMGHRQLDAARFMQEASGNESYEQVPQKMSTGMVLTCKPGVTSIQRSTKDGGVFATHRMSSLAKGFETSKMAVEAPFSVLPSSPMQEDYACASPKGTRRGGKRRVNAEDNVKQVSHASSKEDQHPGQLCNTLRQEYLSVSPPHVCVQSFSAKSSKDDVKGSCRVPDRVVEEAVGKTLNLSSPAIMVEPADANRAAFSWSMDSLNHDASLPVVSCPQEAAQKLRSYAVSSSFQVQSLQKNLPSEPCADIAEKQHFFFNTLESDTYMKLAKHASSKFPGTLDHKSSLSESCSSLEQVPRLHACTNLVHLDSAGETAAVTDAPSCVVDEAINALRTHSNLSLPKHSPQSEYCGSLVGAAFRGNSSSSNLLGSNLVSSMRSFLPLVQQQQIQFATGKREVKVKALETAEAAKRQEEQRMEERQARKKAMEFAKQEKDRAIQEKMKEEQVLLKKEIQEKSKAANEILRQKVFPVGTIKTMLTDTSSKLNSNNHGTLSKVKRTMEMRSKLEENREKLQEERRRKEENWKRKELESAAHKQRQEMAGKKEREERRKRQEASMKWHRPNEKRWQPEIEKENKHRSMGVHDREIRPMEEMSQSNQMENERDRAHQHKCKMDMIASIKTEEWLQSKKLAHMSGSLGLAGTGLTKDNLHSILPLCVPRTDGDGIGMTFLDGHYLQSDITRPTSLGLFGPPMRVLRATTEGSHSGQGTLWHTPPDFSTLRSSRGIANPDTAMQKFNLLQSQMSAQAQVSLPFKDNEGTTPGPTGMSAGQPCVCGPTEETLPKSYEISPYQDSSEGEDSQDGQNRAKKEIPQWARSENLIIQLTRQLEQDPDEIFSGAMSCSLSEVFGTTGSHKRPEFIRRGSSGDWRKDRVTWQEQIRYKMSMGYLH